MTELILRFENESDRETVATVISGLYFEGVSFNTSERVGDTMFFTEQPDVPEGGELDPEEMPEVVGFGTSDNGNGRDTAGESSTFGSVEEGTLPSIGDSEVAESPVKTFPTETAPTVETGEEITGEAVGATNVAVGGDSNTQEGAVTSGTGEFESVPEGSTVVDSSVAGDSNVPTSVVEDAAPNNDGRPDGGLTGVVLDTHSEDEEETLADVFTEQGGTEGTPSLPEVSEDNVTEETDTVVDETLPNVSDVADPTSQVITELNELRKEVDSRVEKLEEELEGNN